MNRTMKQFIFAAMSILLIVNSAIGAITAATVWEVNASGNAGNAALYDPSFGGTDYSQSTSPIATGTVTSATTTVTATTGIFTAAMVGNGITDGTTYVQITAFTSSTIVTVDAAPSWTAVAIKVGGASNLISTIASKVIAGNTIYLEQSGGSFTKTTTETITLTGNAFAPIKVVGYSTTRSVGANTDTKVVFTSSTNSVSLITLTTCTSVWFYNIRCTHTATTRGIGWTNLTGASNRVRWINCECDGTLTGWNSPNSSSNITTASFENCVARNCTSSGFSALRGSEMWVMDGCWADSITGTGLVIAPGSGSTLNIICKNCAFTDNTVNGVSQTGTTQAYSLIRFDNCIFENNADGFNSAITTGIGWIHFENCVFYGNSAYGINMTTAGMPTVDYANAFGANGTAATNNFTTNSSDITLTADPFTNRGSDDYSINNTAGGGALLRAAGLPTRIGSNTYSAATNYVDAGVAQVQSSGGAGPSISGGTP